MSGETKTVIKGTSSKYVKLNVGGSLHYTTIGTLTKQDTMLRAMFSGRMEVLTDSEGNIHWMKIKIKVSFRTVSCNIEIDNAVIHYIIKINKQFHVCPLGQMSYCHQYIMASTTHVRDSSAV